MENRWLLRIWEPSGDFGFSVGRGMDEGLEAGEAGALDGTLSRRGRWGAGGLLQSRLAGIEVIDPSWRFKPAELRRGLDASACVSSALTAPPSGPGGTGSPVDVAPLAGDHGIGPLGLGLVLALVVAVLLAALVVWAVRLRR